MDIAQVRKECQAVGFAYRYLDSNREKRFIPKAVLEERLRIKSAGGTCPAEWTSIRTAFGSNAAPLSPPPATAGDPGPTGSAPATAEGEGDGEPAAGGQGEPAEGEPAEGEGEPATGAAGEGEGDTADMTAAERVEIAQRILSGESVQLAPPPPATPDGVFHERLPGLLQRLKGGSNVLLVGPSGSGKSRMVRDAADILGLPCVVLSLSGGVTESQLMGTIRPGIDGVWQLNGTGEHTAFIAALQVPGICCLDELDGADPNVMVGCNAALESETMELRINATGEIIHKHADCRIVATANTFGNGADMTYAGRNPLDGSTKSRIQMARMFIDYSTLLEGALTNCKVITPKVRKWALVIRKVVREFSLGHIIGTREMIDGSKLLRTGITLAELTVEYLRDWDDMETQRLPARIRTLRDEGLRELAALASPPAPATTSAQGVPTGAASPPLADDAARLAAEGGAS